MNYGRYFIPNLGIRQMTPFSIMPRNSGILNKAFGAIKSFNWKGLLSGANKTLNVVNQTIPLIKQASPMVNNVKNMVRLAKAFGSETNNTKSITNYIKPVNQNDSDDLNNDYPTFFA